MKNALLCFVLGLVTFVGMAQPYGDSKFKQKFNKADALVFDGSYMEALPLLEEMYAYDTSNANLNYLLGVSYLLGKKDHSLAIKRLESATKDVSLDYNEANWKERKAPGLAYLYLGKAYHFKNQFERAVTNYYNYRSFIEMDDVATYNKVRQQIQYAENAMELVKNPVGVKIKNLGPGINTKYTDYCPVVSADGRTLIFTSRREGGTGGAKDEDGNYYDDIYICQRQPNGSWSKPKSIGTNINTPGHDAAIGLSPNGQLLFIYKDDNNDGNIYYSQRKGDEWTAPQPLGSDINTPAWETHASVNATEDLLVFVSNRSEGGFGGRDLWYCKKLPNGEWGLALNMGSVINSQFEEDSPFISADGKTLIFSSQGHTSMGGFDIFRSEFEDGAWTVPENIGYPINTSEDDVFFTLTPDGRTAYYSSHMDGGFGEADIYRLKLELKKSNAVAVARGIMKVPAMAYADISAKITVTDEGGAQIGTYRPNPTTGYYVLILKPGETYSISYEADGYESIEAKIAVADDETYAEYDGTLELEEVVFGENILALQAETEKLEKEKADAIARAEEEARLAAQAEELALEKAKEAELLKEKEAEKRKAEELAALEKAKAEESLALEKQKAAEAEASRRQAEKEAQARARAKEQAAKEAELAAQAAAKVKAEEEALAQAKEQEAKEEAARKEAEMAAQAAAKVKAEEEALAQAKEQEAEEEAARKEAEMAAQAAAKVKAEEEALAQAKEQEAKEEAARKEAEMADQAAAKAKAEEEALAKAAKEAAAREEAEQAELADQKENANKEALVKAEELAAEKTREQEAERYAELAEKRRLELEARIKSLKEQQESAPAEVKEVAVKEVSTSQDVVSVDAEAIRQKREAMLARIEQLKEKRKEVEKKTAEDEVVVKDATKKVEVAVTEKESLEKESEKKVEEINELEEELKTIEERVVVAKEKVEVAKTEKKNAEDSLALDLARKAKLEEEERVKAAEAAEAERQIKEIEEQERQRIEAERLAALEFEREQQEEAERTKRELMQLEALAEQQRQVEEAMKAEERKKAEIEKAEKEAFSQEEILSNAETLKELRELNKKLIADNLDLRKQLAELNAKLDLILARLDYTPEAEKVEIPASNTRKNLQEGKRLILRNIFFDYNLATLRSKSKHELNKLFEFMKENPDIEIVVSGHTDSRGNDDYNLRLSQDRAQAVVDYLVRNGISAERLSAKGYGETRPIARNENADLTDNPIGRQLNRRIEISMPKESVKGVEMEPVDIPNEAKIK